MTVPMRTPRTQASASYFDNVAGLSIALILATLPIGFMRIQGIAATFVVVAILAIITFVRAVSEPRFLRLYPIELLIAVYLFFCFTRLSPSGDPMLPIKSTAYLVGYFCIRSNMERINDLSKWMLRGAYIVRDGRDVMTSMYFHNMRTIASNRNPRHCKRLLAKYNKAFGSDFDPADSRANMARFVELELAQPTGAKNDWASHVTDWTKDREGISVITYEGLLEHPVDSLCALMTSLSGEEADRERAKLAVNRFSFSQMANRKNGVEDRSSFQRKGVSGDWINHFTREAGEIFDAYSGESLVALGYAQDRTWYEKL